MIQRAAPLLALDLGRLGLHPALDRARLRQRNRHRRRARRFRRARRGQRSRGVSGAAPSGRSKADRARPHPKAMRRFALEFRRPASARPAWPRPLWASRSPKASGECRQAHRGAARRRERRCGLCRLLRQAWALPARPARAALAMKLSPPANAATLGIVCAAAALVREADEEHARNPDRPRAEHEDRFERGQDPQPTRD